MLSTPIFRVLVLVAFTGGCEIRSGETILTPTSQTAGTPSQGNADSEAPLQLLQRPQTTTEARWYTMTVSQFFRTPSVRQVIDPLEVDQQLLNAAVFHETNRQRRAHGRPELTHLESLDEAALVHALSMVEHNFFSHENPDPHWREPVDRVRRKGLQPRFVAENLATQFAIRYESGRTAYVLGQANGPLQQFSYQPHGSVIPPHTYRSLAQSLVTRWLQSPEHRENLLSPYPQSMGHACVPAVNEIGMPVFYCVQVFFAEMPR